LGEVLACKPLKPPLASSLKLALHVTLTVLLHATYFTEIPVWNCDQACGGSAGGGCTRSSAALCFYLLSCLYLYTSSLQLKRGFPLIVTEHPLTGATSTALVYLAKAYMALPFLWELRVILDWTFDQTSLTLWDWLKIEDIYVGLTAVRYDMSTRLVFKRGVRQRLTSKLGLGCLAVVLLLLILLGPLLLFSTANPISEPNPILSASVSIGVSTSASSSNVAELGSLQLGAISRYQLEAMPYDDHVLHSRFFLHLCLVQETPYRTCGYGYLFGDWAVDYQRLRFASASAQQWLINPQALSSLRLALVSGAAVNVNVDVTWNRKLAVAGSTRLTYSSTSQPLDKTQRQAMIEAIDGAGADRVAIRVDKLFPKFVRLPTVANAAPIPLVGRDDDWHTQQNLSLVRMQKTWANTTLPPERWWSLEQAQTDASPSTSRRARGFR